MNCPCIRFSCFRLPKGLIKRGVILPNTVQEWERANEYFRVNIHHNNEIKDVIKEINDMQNKIYDYFSETSVQVQDKETNKYENWTKNQLKNHLKLLKSQNAKPAEKIKRVSRVLRKRYKKRSDTDFDHQTEFYKNYWKYCEKVLQPQSDKIKPTFNKTDCKQYFRKILFEKNRHKSFNPPSWMKKLNEPTIKFNLETPSYVQITKILMKIKSSASPCPDDVISIITFKKCPVLRSHLVKIIQTAWKEKNFPKIWRSGETVLAHKKDDPGKPENFRPITLQPLLSKIFTSLIRNRLYTFAADNGYIETNIQKGFWEKISGCVEHIETLTHMINNARIKQRDCVITLLDLKNAFGEVNHNYLSRHLKFTTYLVILLPSSHLYIQIIQFQ